MGSSGRYSDNTMSKPRLFKKSQRDEVCDRLCQYITSPNRRVGERLAPVRKLARHFDTSPTTIKQALSVLEERGYVVKRPRSGTFISAQHRPLTMADTVAICTEASGHVWGDMTQMLLERLHHRHLAATIVDPRFAATDRLLRRMWLSESACLVVRGSAHFPYGMLTDPALQRKPVVALIDWETTLDLPNLHRVLIDQAKAAEQVVDHLVARGHRRMLIVGTHSGVERVERSASADGVASMTYPVQLVRQWESRGGAWQTLSSHPTGTTVELDPEQVIAMMTGDFAPTAVVGLRDAEAAVVQRILRRHKPDLLQQVAMIGYYDTPWSQAADPPITTVNLNLAKVIETASETIDRIVAGQPVEPGTVRVAPVLVERESSTPGARR